VASTPIPGLSGSGTHRLAIEVVQRHHDAGSGRCRCCGTPMPCPPHTHAVLLAAGDHPGRYPAASQPQQPTHPPPHPNPPHEPAHHPPPDTPPPDGNGDDDQGFYVSSRRRRMNPDGYGYERDPS
jgi:hypothetical protein